MTQDTPSKTTGKSETSAETAGVHRHDKRRRHGYRGYPNNQGLGGRIHTGTGFGGVGATGGLESGASVFTPKTLESVEEIQPDPASDQSPARD